MFAKSLDGSAGFPPRNALKAQRPRPVLRHGAYAVEFWHGADLAELAEPWRRLAEEAVEPNVFAEPDVLLPALQHLPEARHVTVLLVWHEAMGLRSLRGLFPLILPRLPLVPGEARIWRPGEASFGLPLVGREDPAGTIEAALAGLASRRAQLSGLVLPQVPVGGGLALALRAVAEGSGRDLGTTKAQELPVLDADASADALARAIGRATLDDLRSERGGLYKAGAVRFEQARTGREIRDAVEEFLVLEAAGAAGRAGAALVQNPAEANFFRTATRQLGRRRRCRVDLLRLNERAVAAAILVESGSQAWLWKLAVDERVAAASPGEQLLLDVSRAQLERKRLARTAWTLDEPAGLASLWRERLALADVTISIRSRHGRPLVGFPANRVQLQARALAQGAAKRLRSLGQARRA